MKLKATFTLRNGICKGQRVTRTRDISPRCSTQRKQQAVVAEMARQLQAEVTKHKQADKVQVYFESMSIQMG